MKYSLGLKPSPPDPRDYKLTAYLEPLTAALPEECIQWLAYKTPVKYQKNLGACAAFSGVVIAEEFHNKSLNTTLDLSEQFLYDEAKKIDGMPGEDGTCLRVILTVLKNVGVCEESYQPYEERYPPKNYPAPKAYENATKYKINSYASVEVGKTALKTAIFQKGPILVGIKAYDNFMTVGKDGIVPMPEGELQGGHALPIIGYNKIGLIAKNSWSENWASGGYATIPWNVWKEITFGEAWSVMDLPEGTYSTSFSFWNWLINLLKGGK
jgi:C1A family cysteine protease